MFSRRWLLATMLVIGALAVMARLGLWQLERLEQRRAFNDRVQRQFDQPQLVLSGAALEEDLASMEYRQVVVRGEYDFANQVVLRNQALDNQAGVHLLTPLRIAGSQQAILVNRGFVPAGAQIDLQTADWSRYNEPGMVVVEGMLRASQSKPDFGRRSDAIPAPGEPPLRAWHFANVSAISAQLPYPLLPVYIQQAPDPSWSTLPARTQPELELSEGPHMGYAIQWFGFAALLGFGYPLYIRRREYANG
jgi:surfeit locus 1 family protein